MIVDETIIYRGWSSLRRVTLRMANGALEERHIESHGDAAAVLAYDPDRRTALLVSMPRAVVVEAGEPDLLEVIAGRIGAEDPAACILREAIEEAGVALTSLDPVATAWSMPGISTERLWLYLAAYSAEHRIAAGGGAENENEQITVHEIALADLAALADAGRLTDLKTLALLQALRLRRPDLF